MNGMEWTLGEKKTMTELVCIVLLKVKLISLHLNQWLAGWLASSRVDDDGKAQREKMAAKAQKGQKRPSPNETSKQQKNILLILYLFCRRVGPLGKGQVSAQVSCCATKR